MDKALSFLNQMSPQALAKTRDVIIMPLAASLGMDELAVRRLMEDLQAGKISRDKLMEILGYADRTEKKLKKDRKEQRAQSLAEDFVGGI